MCGRRLLVSFVWTICMSSPLRNPSSDIPFVMSCRPNIDTCFAYRQLNALAFVSRNVPSTRGRNLQSSTRCSHSRKGLIFTSQFGKECRVRFSYFSRPVLNPGKYINSGSSTAMCSVQDVDHSDTEEEIDPGDIPGTLLRVLKYPHPQLRAADEEILVFDDNLKQGVGLAAPQVGINKRLMVFNPEGDPQKWLKEVVLVNPRIVEVSESTDVEVEACLSFPKMQGSVRRHKWIKVEAFDVKGKKIKKKVNPACLTLLLFDSLKCLQYEGWEARVFQHEYDHLEGRLYIDRLEGQDREQVQGRLDTLVGLHREAFPDLPPAL